MRIEADQVKDKLYEMLGKLEYGEERQYIITRRGEPVAKLVDYYSDPYEKKIGVAQGVFTVPDDFDADNEEIAKLFGVE